MNKRVTFNAKLLPYVLLAPQIAVTLAFFIWPSGQALWQSVILEDAFGGNSRFVGFANFERLFANEGYWASVRITLFFSLMVASLGLGFSLLLATMADRIVRGATAYKALLVWPYAVAPAVAGVLFGFLFNPSVGIVAYFLKKGIGYEFNFVINGGQALFLVILAATWNQISYNFLFFLAGLQSVPRSLMEAAAIDGAGPVWRFWTITLPLLSPTAFFLLVVNIIYAFFGTFGVIDAMTKGGPARATEILVFKVYNDGFRGQDFGGSAAQSAILMAIVVALTVIQFRFIERRVQY
jgi:sn-glycerol 3-phosphate transport system permease protein